MGKTSRKTKAKNKDFQKVKLKVGKKLPKGLNETSTAFKTGAIQIREQLRSAADTGEPTTRHKLGLKDLLSQCQHYNAGVRHEAITSLRQLLTTNPHVLATNLGIIIERTAQICLDKDGNVRQAGSRLFRACMSHISSNQISPFFPVLSAHLCCAMTHITEDIQIDSLSLLDVCLEFYPDLVISKQSNLLQNFVEQISRQSQTSKPGKGTAGRSLLVNPDSKLSSQKWRVKVLERLHKLLQAVTKQKDEPGDPAKHDGKCVYFAADSPTAHLILSHDAASAHGGYTISQQGGAGSGNILSETDQLKKYIEILLPLLMQSWVEAGPAQFSSTLPGNAMDVNALAMLSSVLRVLQLLLRCVQLSEEHTNIMEWIRKEFVRDLLTYFLPYFPYSMHQTLPHKQGGKHRGKEKKNKDKDLPQVSMVMLNLTVIDVMCHFLDDARVTSSKSFSNLTSYISHAMRNEKLSSDQLTVLLHILHQLVEISSDGEMLTDLLDAAYILYANQNPLSSEKMQVSQFFSALLQSRNSSKFISLSGVNHWIQHLPKLLLQISSQKPQGVDKLLSIMRQVAVLGEAAFLDALQKYSLRILGEAGSPSGLSSWSAQSQKGLFELFAWLPEWTSTHFACICKHCHKESLHPEAIQYLMQILLYRYQNTSHQAKLHFNLADFISFLFSVCIGYSQSDLRALQIGSSGSLGTPDVIVSADLIQRWDKHQVMTKIVCGVLHQFTNSGQLAQVFWVFLENLLDSLKSIPLLSSMGLISICQATTAVNTQQRHLAEKLAPLLSSTLLSLIKLPTLTDVENLDVATNVETLVLKNIVTVSSETEILSDACLTQLLYSLKGSVGDDLIALAKIMNRWLSHSSLLTTVRRNKQVIMNTCREIEESTPSILESQIWSDFLYGVSLVH